MVVLLLLLFDSAIVGVYVYDEVADVVVVVVGFVVTVFVIVVVGVVAYICCYCCWLCCCLVILLLVLDMQRLRCVLLFWLYIYIYNIITYPCIPYVSVIMCILHPPVYTHNISRCCSCCCCFCCGYCWLYWCC